MDLIAQLTEGTEEEGEAVIGTLLIGLGITALICVFLYFVLERTKPTWTGPVVAGVAILGALLTLLAAF